jgi:hypothetical protein
MRLFVNSMEGEGVVDFFELPPKLFSHWDKFCYWFKSTYGQSQSPTNLLKSYKNLTYNQGEAKNVSNLCFTKLYNQILEIIRPHNQVALMNYYIFLTPYRHSL